MCVQDSGGRHLVTKSAKLMVPIVAKKQNQVQWCSDQMQIHWKWKNNEKKLWLWGITNCVEKFVDCKKWK